MAAVEEHAPQIGVSAACEALTVSRATVYRRRNTGKDGPWKSPPRPTPTRALSSEERREVLVLLHSERFVDMAPESVVATLVDEDKAFPCSARTMYRILKDNKEVRERRNQLRHPNYKKPELLATGPNQVWSWDITKLKGPAKWNYFYLYVLLDIFSRFVVGWLLAHRECQELAKRLIRESCDKQDIKPDQLTIHADRGPAMKAQGLAQMLASLSISKSHNRPHVSNDNPFSESQFKTIKYRPQFPDRFDSFEHGLEFCRDLFPWYNTKHRHSSLCMLTPEMVHYGHAYAVLHRRHETMMEAYNLHPERFVNGPPKMLVLPKEVWINPPNQKPEEDKSKSELHTPGQVVLASKIPANREEIMAPQVLH